MSNQAPEFDFYNAVEQRRTEVCAYLIDFLAAQASGAPLDKGACERAVGAIYRMNSMNAPSLVWCRSVFELAGLALTWSSTGSVSFVTESSHEGSKFQAQWQQLASSCAAQKIAQRIAVRKCTPGGEEIRNRNILSESRHFYGVFKQSVDQLCQRLGKVTFPAGGIGGLASIMHEFSKLRSGTDLNTVVRQRNLIEISATRDVMSDLWPVLVKEAKPVDMGLKLRIVRQSTPSVDTDFCLWISSWEMFDMLPFLVALDVFPDFSLEFFDGQIRGQLGAWRDLSLTGCWFLFFRDMCFVCQPPKQIVTDRFGVLHNENGPGIAFGDGYGQFFLNGRPVERHVVENPQSITVPEIEQEDNAEIRRILIERYGLSRYILDSGAQKIHEDDSGVLYRKELVNDEPLVVVMVKNSTPEHDGSFKNYFLRVPPEVETAKEAVAWTFRMSSDLYAPKVET